MPFEIWDEDRAKALRQPLVSVLRDRITVSAAGAALLGQPKVIQLMFDPGERLLGICPANLGTPGAKAVQIQDNESITIQAGPFIVHYGLHGGVSKRWTAELRDGVLIVDTKQPGADVSRRKGHNK